MRWKRIRENGEADRLIAEAYARRIAKVTIPPYPVYGRSDQAKRGRPSVRGWSSGRVRAVNLGFVLFFALSFSIVFFNVGGPPLFATYLVPSVEKYQLNESLPRTLEYIRSLIGPGLIGG